MSFQLAPSHQDGSHLLDGFYDLCLSDTTGVVGTGWSAQPHGPSLLPPRQDQQQRWDALPPRQNLDTADQRRPPLHPSMIAQQQHARPAATTIDDAADDARSFPKQPLPHKHLVEAKGGGEKPWGAYPAAGLVRTITTDEAAPTPVPLLGPGCSTSMGTVGSFGSFWMGSSGTVGSSSSLPDTFKSNSSMDCETGHIDPPVPVPYQCLQRGLRSRDDDGDDDDDDDEDNYDHNLARPEHTTAKLAMNRIESFTDGDGGPYHTMKPTPDCPLTESMASLGISTSDMVPATTVPLLSPPVTVTPTTSITSGGGSMDSVQFLASLQEDVLKSNGSLGCDMDTTPCTVPPEGPQYPPFVSHLTEFATNDGTHKFDTDDAQHDDMYWNTGPPSPDMPTPFPAPYSSEESNSSSSSLPGSDEESEGGTRVDHVIEPAMATSSMMKEKCTPNSQTSNGPTSLDVIFGRGGGSNHHPGNKSYLDHIRGLQEEYKKLCNKEKTKFSQKVVEWVHQRGGRFLQRTKEGNNSSCWCEASNDTAREKVSMALRQDHTPEGRAKKRQRQKSNK
jgi:hypothetical protein